MLAPTIGGQLLLRWHWHAIFWVLGGCGLACGIAVALDLAETLPPGRRAGASILDVPRQYLALLFDPRFIGYALAIGCGSGVLFAYITGSPFAFMQLHGISTRAFGVYFASNAIGMFGAAQVNRWLLRWLGAHGNLAACLRGERHRGGAARRLRVERPWRIPRLLPRHLRLHGHAGPDPPQRHGRRPRPFRPAGRDRIGVAGDAPVCPGAGAGALVGFLHDGTALPMAATVAGCGLCGCLVVAVSERRRAA